MQSDLEIIFSNIGKEVESRNAWLKYSMRDGMHDHSGDNVKFLNIEYTHDSCHEIYELCYRNIFIIYCTFIDTGDTHRHMNQVASFDISNPTSIDNIIDYLSNAHHNTQKEYIMENGQPLLSDVT